MTDQISGRSYVGSIYRTRFLAVSHSFVRTFTFQITVGKSVVEYLGLHDQAEKRCFFGLTATFGSREVSLESNFKASDRKIIFYVFNVSLFRKEVLSVLCMADSHEASTCSKVFSRKGPNSSIENMSSERLFKAQNC